MDQDRLSELISAYLDEELDARERAFVEHLIRTDSGARQLHEELRRTAALVASLPRRQAPPSLASEVMRQVERAELLAEPVRRTVRGGSRRVLVGVLSMAALLAIVVTAGLWYGRAALAPRPLGTDQLASASRHERDTGGPAANGARRSSNAGVDAGEAQPPEVSDAECEEFQQQWVAAAVGPEGYGSSGAAAPSWESRGPQTPSFAPARPPVRVEVAVSDAKAQRAVLGKLSAQFTQAVTDTQHFEEVAAGAETRSRRTPAPPEQTALSGGPDGPGRLLVRVPQSQFNQLVDAVVEATNGGARVSFVAGSTVIRGVGNARKAAARIGAEPLVRGVARPAETQQPVSPAVPKVAEVRKDSAAADDAGLAAPPGGDLWAGMVRALGIEPEEPIGATDSRAAPKKEESTSEGASQREAAHTAEEPSLVARKLKELDESSARRRPERTATAEPPSVPGDVGRATEVSADASGEWSAGTTPLPEPVVTVVLDVVVAKPPGVSGGSTAAPPKPVTPRRNAWPPK
ncbi:MAG: hypothetical protein HY763_01530 [Planctomycetes bacterium]|nr:hypothetical protein [Planctomycetota bacterium]